CYCGMRLLIAFLALLFVATATDVSAQSRKKKKQQVNDRPAAGYGSSPSALAPGTTTETMAPRQSKKKSNKVTYDQQREYYERVAAVAKAREKAAKIMEKPQYSDPMYFGHKRKPKKRPPHKMKFCKECGIRH